MIDKNFIESCLKEALLLQGKCLALQEEKKDIVARVEAAKIYLSKQPEYVKFLQHLQNILHRKNIGAFSELLSYFVKDVLQKDKDIIFDLYTYHNLPALKIEAENNGCRENIFEGNGGSIANIVSTGLRLIALSRLNHRKFIVLDEPDCWLKPDHVPLFAKIIGEISAQLHIQTIIISHHHWEYFKDYGRVIELKQDGPHLVTEIIHDTPIVSHPTKKTDVIEKIVLSRFMSHYDTIFDLHPHLTCLIGENDIGKSVLATAIKSVAYADSSDSYIMHHEKEARVLIQLSDSRQILWQRFLKTDQENTQKVKYTLFSPEHPQGLSEYSSQETPEFINKELNICTTEDIDVHIGNQKQPVFLLSTDTKPQQRAKILSLGKESLIIQKMMENIKIKTRQAKQTETEGEKRYAVIEKQLGILENINDIVDRSEQYKDEGFILEKQQITINELIDTIDLLEQIELIASTKKIDNHYIKPPQLNDIKELNSIISQYENVDFIANQTPIFNQVQSIELHPISELEEHIHATTLSEQIANIPFIDKLDNMEPLISTASIEKAIEMISEVEHFSQYELINYQITTPKIQLPLELLELIEQMEDNEKTQKELEQKKNVISQWEIKLAAESKSYLDEYGSVCPTCHQHITQEHLKGKNHA